MPARQREVGATVVKGRVVPVIRVMAGCAICAELTVVFVILLMAGIAISRRTLEDVVHMAALTTYFPMFAIQFKGGQVMVKVCALPILRCMTGFALGSKTAIVLIILLMTGITIAGRAFVHVVHMALFAGYLIVFTFQLECREVVVKFCGQPAFGGMANTTLVTICTTMWIVFAMTREAILRQGL